jgi:hypothetical protein|tara:strand:+ start:140 stop:406 length:267 start_codon:yes stop_codon:yes gene_type:complete
MGKLTVAEAEQLEKEGVLSSKAIKEMQNSGLVSSRKRNTRRYMKTANGSWVCPQLYFQGLKGAEYSKKMVEFREKFNTLVQKYTTIKK